MILRTLYGSVSHIQFLLLSASAYKIYPCQNQTYPCQQLQEEKKHGREYYNKKYLCFREHYAVNIFETNSHDTCLVER